MIVKKTIILRATTAVAVIATLLVGSASAARFSDVSSNAWYYDAVELVGSAGVFTGYSDGTFRPNAPITRAESASLFSRMLSDDGYDWYSEGYEDVPADAWYADAVAMAGAAMGGIKQVDQMAQYPLTWFYPDQNCTREDFAYGLFNILGLPEEFGVNFDDWMDIDSRYLGAIYSLKEYGFITGDPLTADSRKYGNFRPKDTISRAEVAQILYNIYDLAGRPE